MIFENSRLSRQKLQALKRDQVDRYTKSYRFKLSTIFHRHCARRCTCARNCTDKNCKYYKGGPREVERGRERRDLRLDGMHRDARVRVSRGWSQRLTMFHGSTDLRIYARQAKVREEADGSFVKSRKRPRIKDVDRWGSSNARAPISERTDRFLPFAQLTRHFPSRRGEEDSDLSVDDPDLM